MGIDVYAYWQGQTAAESGARDERVFSIDAGEVGYLREAYHGGPYATRVLLPEAFADIDVESTEDIAISAAVLRSRLEQTLATACERERLVYNKGEDDPDTQTVCDSFTRFVELCERMEAKTGAPCWFVASW